MRESSYLYWDMTCEVACPRHAPLSGTEAWTSERWSRMTAAEGEAYEREFGHPPVCHGCEAVAGRR